MKIRPSKGYLAPKSDAGKWANLNAYTTTARNGQELLRLDIKAEDFEHIVEAIIRQGASEQGYIQFTLYEKPEFKKSWQNLFFSVGVKYE